MTESPQLNQEDELEERTPAWTILQAAQNFTADAEALVELFEVAVPTLKEKQSEYRKELQKLSESKGEDETATLAEFDRLNRLHAKLFRGSYLFRGHMLVALVSRFDAFIASVCRELLFAFPSRLGDKAVSFADAAQFKTIEELERKIISDEVDAQMRGSHTDQLKFLSTLSNVPLGEDEPELLGKFIELTERRNCHVHSSGRASAQYIRTCSQKKIPLPDGLEEGGSLNVTVQYLSRARRVLTEIAFKIAQTIVRKLFSESRDDADTFVNHVGLQMLKDGRDDEALRVFDFAVQLKGNWAGDDNNRRMFIVNKAQVLKRLGKTDAAMKLLDLLDWSAVHPKFSVAMYALREDFGKAAKLMPISEISEEQYRDWPLFDEFKKTTDFKAAFLKLFGHDFDQSVIDAATEAIAEIDSENLSLIGSAPPCSRRTAYSLPRGSTAPRRRK